MDNPILECAAKAQAAIATGATVFQTWTCSHCKARQHMATPNIFFQQGVCEECNKLSDITECGFTAMFGDPTPFSSVMQTYDESIKEAEERLQKQSNT